MKYIVNIIIAVIAIFVITACNNSPVEKEFIYVHVPVHVKDTIAEKANIMRIATLEHELKLTSDSLNIIKDSLNEKLFVANYKLARIKRYNEIAAKGNNIKYLRGWINRVLKN
jgi:uncharacterized lipoprotein YehR (DUF1307 family)